MSHSHESKRDSKLPLEEVKDQSIHPFFEKNDLTILSLVTPLLSSNGQRLLSFFVNFGSNESVSNPLGNIGEVFQQLSSNQRNSLMELAPTILNMLSSQDGKSGGPGGLNPALLSTLLTSLMNNKKED